jgi:hypothetical protein
LSGRDGQIHTVKNLISESSCLLLRSYPPSSPPLLPRSKDPLFRMPANVEDRSKEGASLYSVCSVCVYIDIQIQIYRYTDSYIDIQICICIYRYTGALCLYIYRLPVLCLQLVCPPMIPSLPEFSFSSHLPFVHLFLSAPFAYLHSFCVTPPRSRFSGSKDSKRARAAG